MTLNKNVYNVANIVIIVLINTLANYAPIHISLMQNFQMEIIHVYHNVQMELVFFLKKKFSIIIFNIK